MLRVRGLGTPISRIFKGYSASQCRFIHFRASQFNKRGPTVSNTPLVWSNSKQAIAPYDDDRQDNQPITKTAKMLLASRNDLYHRKFQQNRVQRVYDLVNLWVVRPIHTISRFCYLILVFTPALVTGIPVILNITSNNYNKLWYAWLTKTLEHAGPSFIKLGQWAASRHDIFPHSMCAELAKLHSHAKMHSFEYTKQAIQSAFNENIEDCFAYIDPKPIGVGAMAQVYKAIALNGDSVAVKVLHPNVETIIDRDLAIMRVIAAILHKIPTMEWLSLPGEVETFGFMMQSQLDLRIEAENLRTFADNFKKNKSVNFPKPYMEMCTREVLVEEFIKGISLEKIIKFGNQSDLERKIGELGLNSFLKMLLLDNFIHTDLHAGNIFLSVDNYLAVDELNNAENKRQWQHAWQKIANCSPKLYFIDAGLVTELTPTNQKNFIDLFSSIATFDGKKAGQLMIDRSRTPETVINANDFVMKTKALVDQVKKRTFTLQNIGISDVLSKMMDMVQTHHVRLESDFITVVISILLLEGVGRSLNPDLDIFESSLPVLRRVGQPHLNPKMPLSEMSFSDMFNIVRVWVLLEGRKIITVGVHDYHGRPEYDVFDSYN